MVRKSLLFLSCLCYDLSHNIDLNRASFSTALVISTFSNHFLLCGQLKFRSIINMRQAIFIFIRDGGPANF